VSTLEPPYGAADPAGMAARIQAIPDHIEAALANAKASPWRPPIADPSVLAVGGMGGSAIAGDLTAGLYADRLPKPMLVVRDYRWPAWAGPSTLALLCSYSGNTEETLALYRDGEARKMPRLALTTGGALAALATRDGVGVHVLPGGSPPRAALFSSWVPVTMLLHALGWVEDPAPEWAEAVTVVRAGESELGPDVPEAANPAKRLARALTGRFLFVYASAERTAAVALRMRQQLHENAKLPGHSAVVPELNHNEIVGWERAGAFHRGASVVLLRDREDAEEHATRLTLTAEYARRQGAEVHEWTSRGESRLARLASLIQFGDYVSLYLALLGGADPTAIPSIDEFKHRLANPGASARGR
jgi:glucose/mannose-6-phosphate isomerase